MTEEILQAAIMRLKSRSTERFGIIKDLYHRPATTQTVEQIAQHAVALAQLEGGLITLQQYAEVLSQQTENEMISNMPKEQPTPVEVEEENEEATISESDLETRSSTYRKNKKTQELLRSSSKQNES